LESIEAKKLIAGIQKSLVEEGVDSEDVVESLKKLREYAIEEKDPTVTRVLRMCYEHIEEFVSFNVGMPIDEEDEEEEAEMLVEGISAQANSLYYLMELLRNSRNERNREEIIFYRDALKRYWQANF